jgi:hypothetical protein
MPSTPTQQSESTRYLCAAAYLDRGFANQVITKVLEGEHRAVAPSYGVDVVPWSATASPPSAADASATPRSSGSC